MIRTVFDETQFLLMHGTEKEWQDANPVLGEGEEGVVIEPGKIPYSKIGDGKTPWSDLPIFHGQPGKNGKDGRDGRDGRDGKDGERGIPGKDGKNGKDGVSLVGPRGLEGPPGRNGKDGITPDISVFAPTDSPQLTGEPTAPTPETFDSSERIATTEFVKRSTREEIAKIPASGGVMWTGGNSGSGVSNLSELDDVTITTPIDDQVLKYSSGKWINGTNPAGVTDHGLLTGLADDDHTQYIKHSLATAANDVLMASGAGAFIKKTINELKTALGLGTAAYTAATDYAVSAHSHTTLPSSDEKAGLVGTSGTAVSASNKLVDNADTRLTDGRTDANAVHNALFDAESIIASVADNTPAAVTVAEQTLIGRITGGHITALNVAAIKTLLGMGTAASNNTGDFAAASHAHAGSDITSGSLDGDRLPAISTTKRAGVPAAPTPTGKFLKDDDSWDTPAGGGAPSRLSEVTKSIAFATTDAFAGKNDSVDIGATTGQIARLRLFADWVAGQQAAASALQNNAAGALPTDPYITYDNLAGTFAAGDYLLCDSECMECVGIASGAIDSVRAYTSNNTTYADETADAASGTANDVALCPSANQTDDAIYIGHATHFAGIYIVIGTAGVYTGTITWEYYDTDTTWKALTVVTDTTASFTAAAGGRMVSWNVPTTWAAVAVDGITKFYVRARVSACSAFTTRPLATLILLAPALSLAVVRGAKGTVASFHDDNAMIYKANQGVKICLYPNSSYNQEEALVCWANNVTAKWTTNAAITAGDKWIPLTADPTLTPDLQDGEVLLIDDAADELCRGQTYLGSVAGATYDNSIFTRDALAAHDTTKSVYRVLQYDVPIPFAFASGTTLYLTVQIMEKITGTVNLSLLALLDKYA